ncbi:MAG: hypothetical protein ACP5NM_10635 [Thiomonas sp.]
MQARNRRSLSHALPALAIAAAMVSPMPQALSSLAPIQAAQAASNPCAPAKPCAPAGKKSTKMGHKAGNPCAPAGKKAMNPCAPSK